MQRAHHREAFQQSKSAGGVARPDLDRTPLPVCVSGHAYFVMDDQDRDALSRRLATFPELGDCGYRCADVFPPSRGLEAEQSSSAPIQTAISIQQQLFRRKTG